jgi:uncharacterized phage protein (TIGR01671 family)
MREIKFRAWDKEEGIMLTWYKWADEIKDAIPYDAGDEWTERCILMQYTGLKDKNGKEIYEGDIYRYGRFALNDEEKFGRDCYKNLPSGINKDDITTEHRRYKLLWNYHALLRLQRQIENNPDVDGVEVIGNIYENPEILG